MTKKTICWLVTALAVVAGLIGHPSFSVAPAWIYLAGLALCIVGRIIATNENQAITSMVILVTLLTTWFTSSVPAFVIVGAITVFFTWQLGIVANNVDDPDVY